MNIYKVFEELEIKFDEIEHKDNYSDDEKKFMMDNINGIGSESYLLTDGMRNYYLALVCEDKDVNLNKLAKLVSKDHLSYASDYEIKEALNIQEESMTILSIVNDKYHKITLLIDKDLVDKKVLFHLYEAKVSISIEYKDLIKFIKYETNKYMLFK